LVEYIVLWLKCILVVSASQRLVCCVRYAVLYEAGFMVLEPFRVGVEA